MKSTFQGMREMGTEIATDRMKAAGIVNYASSLPPRKVDEHRAFIGLRIEALLDPYWDRRPADLILAEIVLDWMDALQMFTPEEIRTACREYLNGPDRRSKPKPGDIRALIVKARSERLAAIPKPRDPPRTGPRADPKAVADIMASFRGVAE
jgi:hypothetical protein